MADPNPQSQASPETSLNESSGSWTVPQRLGFRFAFVYGILYFFPFPIQFIPLGGYVSLWWDNVWGAFIPWTATHILRFEIPPTSQFNGSGDTTFNYVQDFSHLLMAVVITVIWSGADWGRPAYPRLLEYLRVYLRFAAGSAIIGYGVAKIIPSQFPAPEIDRLMQPYGESSPMGLLWTFMGASTAYNVFAGLCEFIGGFLLYFRRTTTLGALISSAVMLNVVMLNFCYDVPVKLYSSQLFLTFVFLALPDVKRLLDVLVFHRPVSPRPLGQLFRNRHLRIASALLKYLLIGVFLFERFSSVLARSGQFDADAPKSPVAGLYEVDAFTLGGETLPALATQEKRWRRVVIKDWGGVSFLMMNDALRRFRPEIDPQTGEFVRLDPSSKTFDLTSREGDKTHLVYAEPEPGVLTLEGTVAGEAVTARLHKTDAKKFLLISRGFHWINEFPFNR